MYGDTWSFVCQCDDSISDVCARSSGVGLLYSSHYWVYYESMKRELNKRLILECRCDARLKEKVEGSTRIHWPVHYFFFVFSVFPLKRSKEERQICTRGSVGEEGARAHNLCSRMNIFFCTGWGKWGDYESIQHHQSKSTSKSSIRTFLTPKVASNKQKSCHDSGILRRVGKTTKVVEIAGNPEKRQWLEEEGNSDSHQSFQICRIMMMFLFPTKNAKNTMYVSFWGFSKRFQFFFY